MLMYLKDNTKDLVENNEENNIISPSKSLRNRRKYITALCINTDMHTHAYIPCI